MHCKEVESALEQEQIAPLAEEARVHVASCASCQNLIADFNAIIAAAERMPAEIAPPDRVWISLRAQLEAESLIREQAPQLEQERPAPWRAIARLFRSRVMATAAVGLVIVLAALFQLRPTASRAPVPAPPSDPFVNTAAALSEQEHDLANIQRVAADAAPSPVDASLQKNLRDLDEFIAECSRHLKEQPQDELAREYLAVAYQQKAELLSAMIDRGRSVN